MSKRGPIPVELKPGQITALIDSREQWPLDLSPLRVVRASDTRADGSDEKNLELRSLPTGDYSLLYYRDVVCVERKTLDDLLACVGRERKRFDQCIQRMRSFPHKLLVIEATREQLRAGEWRSQITPQAAIRSLKKWRMLGIPYELAGSHEGAGKVVVEFLVDVANYYGEKAARHAAAGLSTDVLQTTPEAETELEPAPF